VDRLLELNALADPNRILAGQRLRVAASPPSPAPRSAAPAAPRVRAARTHTVGAGEHLTGIARRYDVTIAAIVSANGLVDASRIYAGQRLTIPGAVPAAATAPASAPAPPAAPTVPAARTHTVGAGEHLTGIARRYDVTIAAIVSANGLVDAGRIYAGQRLTIPGAVPAAATARGARGGPTAAMPASMAALVGKREVVGELIVAEANRYGVPPALALAVAWQESGWQQGVVSGAGAVGVMQLMPDTADWIAEAMLGTAVDPADLRQNVRAGVRLLAHYLDRYEGNRGLVLAAYYQGQTAADRHGIFPVSRPYIASITVLERLFAG
jgi:N-acetylmuramoyl-L-alanine amidase